MSNYDVNFDLDVAHRRCVLGNEPMIFHCNHYNFYLQRTIVEDAPYIDSSGFLVGAAAEVSYAQLSNVFDSSMDIEARKRKAEEIFQWAGFGLINLDDLDEDGGTMQSESTHYSSLWERKFGPSEKPVDYFTTGWVAGALAAIYDFSPADIQAEQTKCLSVEGDDISEYKFARGESNFSIYESVGLGNLTTDKPIEVEDNNVDYDGILSALAGMDIEGNEEGLIPAFGVILTRHYANYYNRISFEFIKAMEEKFGDEGRESAIPLLIEAGHQCAFNTFGGIMTSQEWDALIKPQLEDKKDWVHGIVAAVNALGWGRWQVTNTSEEGAEFTLFNDYESVGYEAMYGEADEYINFLAHGGVAGILDLVYLCDIESKPDLTPEFYAKHFQGEEAYVADCLQSRACGAENTKFKVYKP